MSNKNNLEEWLGKMIEPIPAPQHIIPSVSIESYKVREEDTIGYKIQQQTNQIIKKSEEQIALLTKQNEQLVENNQKLVELYGLKEKEYTEAKNGEKKAKKYNRWMLFITILSMLAAMASWIVPLFSS